MKLNSILRFALVAGIAGLAVGCTVKTDTSTTDSTAVGTPVRTDTAAPTASTPVVNDSASKTTASSNSTPATVSGGDTSHSVKHPEWVRAQPIHLASLDADKDGKLYQCEMDFDVISDTPGDCPKCDMKLTHVTLDEARANAKGGNIKVD
jgi:hypothetical protein